MTTTLRSLSMLALGAALGCGQPDSVAEEEHHDDADSIRVVTMTSQQIASAQLQLGVTQRRVAGSEVEATAQIEAPPDRTARVAARMTGRILELRARVGDAVTAGRALALVESPELSRSMASFVSAVSAAALARETADKERTLFQRGISSEREWRTAEAEASRSQAERSATENELRTMGVADSTLQALQAGAAPASTFPLVSPIAGHVVEQRGTLGEMVEPGFAVFTVMDTREVWAVIDIYEQDLMRVAAGQAVQVRVAAVPGRVFRGRVDNVGTMLEPGTRTAKVRVVLSNTDLALKPGMFATVTLEGIGATGAGSGLFVPAAAVQRDADETIVFVPIGAGRFESRQITAGTVDASWVEVVAGLEAGDSVVTNGSFLLKSQLRKSELGESHPH